MNNLYLLLLLVVFIGCKKYKKENEKNQIKVSMENRMDRWLNYNEFNLSNFQDTSKIILTDLWSSDAIIKNEKESLYQEHYVYNNDSSYYIDIDSQSRLFDKDLSGVFCFLDHENDIIHVVDHDLTSNANTQNKFLRLNIGLSEIKIEEAFWKNNSSFYLLGYERDESQRTPLLLEFRFDNDTLLLFKANSKQAKSLYNKKVRLKDVEFCLP
ncbi:hypothetical protein EYV94_27275 [Puteibacter caeruleilacunae]|nr:hypothetical protein EYV94_27275 [Puteibacter caeruleilacunae]